MSLVNYDDLKTEVAAWLARSDLTSKIPDFITIAEGKINRKLVHFRQNYLYETTYSATDTTRQITLPSDLIEIIQIQYKGTSEAATEYRAINYVAPDMIESYYQSTGEPLWYTLRGANIEFNAPAGQTWDIRIFYRDRWDLATSSTNWLMTNYPDVYLEGSKYEAAKYIRDRELMAETRSDFELAIKEISNESQSNTDDQELSVAELSHMASFSGYNVITDR